MIAAIAKIYRGDGPSVTLTIIGIGEEELFLKEYAEKLGARSAINFKGAVPFGPLLFSELQAYDLLIATPLAQDTPRSALDGFASGLPILAYGIDYYVELQEMSGAVCTVPWRDQRALVEEIVKLNEQRGLLSNMSRNAVDFSRRNTQEAWLEKRARWTRDFCM